MRKIFENFLNHNFWRILKYKRVIRDVGPVTMQSSNRGVRAANRVDAADDEGRPTGGEVYNRPGAGGKGPP